MKQLVAVIVLLLLAACSSGDSPVNGDRLLELFQGKQPGQEKPAILADPTGKVQLIAFNLQEGTPAQSGQPLSFQPELRYDPSLQGKRVGIVISGRDAKNTELVSHTMIFDLGSRDMILTDLGKPLIIPAAQKSLIARWVPVSMVTY